MWVCALLYGMSQSWKTVIFFQGMEPPILLVSVVLAVDILLNYGSSASSLSKLQVCYYDKTIKLNAAENRFELANSKNEIDKKTSRFHFHL